MEDDSAVPCTSCDIIVPSSYVMIEAVCIDCRIKASWCMTCSIKFPAQAGSTIEKREEKLIIEVWELRTKAFTAERERKIIHVLSKLLQKQQVCLILFQYDI